MLAIVRVRGRWGVKPKIKKTLELLKLHKPNHCVVYPDTPSIRGMLKIVENYVAYGKISEETFKALFNKRGEGSLERALELFKSNNKIDVVFRLHPPRKGWKSIKDPYPRGALGERDDMDNLLKRMM